MTLKERLLDAVLDGELGTGVVVTRKAFMEHFSDVGRATTGVFLSNSEMKRGVSHSPHYDHFTECLSEGVYRIHPGALLERLMDREKSQ